MRACIALALLALARPVFAQDVEVYVEGRRNPASSRDPTAASTVVRDEALARPGADAADVLADVPGVQLTRTGSSADLATASIRGASSAQTPVYLAGIRLNDDVTGTADLSLVPLWMLDRVEVFRGNAPAEADRLGIGGAIFFEPLLPKRSRVGAGAEVGSFGERGAWLAGAVAAPEGASLVALRTERAENDFEYEDDRGTVFDPTDDRSVRRPNADHEQVDAWAIGRWQLAPRGARLTLVTNALSREQGVTGLGVIPATRARAHVDRLLVGASTSVPLRRFRLELTSSFLEAGSQVSDPAAELALPSPTVTTRGQRFVQHVRISRSFERTRLRLGLGQEIERLHIGELAARRATSRASVSVEQDFAPVLVHALGAAECHGTAGPDGADRCGTFAPTGRLGAAVRATEHLRVLANVGRYVRVPTLGELHGIAAAVRGNSALAPESAIGADVGLRAASRHAWVDGFVFARWVDDLVAYRRSGFGYVRPFNVGQARMLGAELAAAADMLDHLLTELAVTALDPRDTTPGRTLANDLVPYQSRLVASARLELYSRAPAPRIDRVSVGGRARYRSSRVADSAGLIVLAEQATLDADVATLLLGERIAVRGSIENVLDSRHFDTLGLPLPGRSFHAALEAWWF